MNHTVFYFNKQKILRKFHPFDPDDIRQKRRLTKPNPSITILRLKGLNVGKFERTHIVFLDVCKR